jgi:hypothetical protein
MIARRGDHATGAEWRLQDVLTKKMPIGIFG